MELLTPDWDDIPRVMGDLPEMIDRHKPVDGRCMSCWSDDTERGMPAHLDWPCDAAVLIDYIVAVQPNW